MKSLHLNFCTFSAVVLLSLTSLAHGHHHQGEQSRCTESQGTGQMFCIGDEVGYAYNFAVGTIVEIYEGRADVAWNIQGSGFGSQLSVDVLIQRSNHSGGAQPANGQILDMNGANLGPGSIVKYRYNEAVGTVEHVYGRTQTVDVNWNIQGSGYGQSLPATDVIKVNGQSQGGNQRSVVDGSGRRLYVGAVVGYNYNEAIGTVDRIYSDSQTVDVNWNIQGSGYGKFLPARDVTVR